MFILTNKDNVIIDICENIKPCKMYNGVTVLCKGEDAYGYVGSDNDTVYAKVGKNIKPSFDDIASVYYMDVEEIPSDIERLKYTYDGEMFVVNEEPYPEDATTLTTESKVNTSDIDICLQAIAELYEKVGE